MYGIQLGAGKDVFFFPALLKTRKNISQLTLPVPLRIWDFLFCIVYEFIK